MGRDRQGLPLMRPVGRDWEFRLCPESNGESGVLIDRSDIIRIAFKKKLLLLLCEERIEGPDRRQEGQAGGY